MIQFSYCFDVLGFLFCYKLTEVQFMPVSVRDTEPFNRGVVIASEQLNDLSTAIDLRLDVDLIPAYLESNVIDGVIALLGFTTSTNTDSSHAIIHDFQPCHSGRHEGDDHQVSALGFLHPRHRLNVIVGVLPYFAEVY